MLDEFRFRVRLYNTWDQRLGHYTRFFGAAAATNALLGTLCTNWGFLVSQSTMDFLSDVGTTLQGVNLRVAESIACGLVWPSALDHTIILHEQTVVELRLRNLALANGRAHRLAVREIDRLLSFHRLGMLVASTRCPNLRLYYDVLKNIAELGQSVSFASQRDRVLIGRGLIDHLRQQESAARSADMQTARGGIRPRSAVDV